MWPQAGIDQSEITLLNKGLCIHDKVLIWKSGGNLMADSLVAMLKP